MKTWQTIFRSIKCFRSGLKLIVIEIRTSLCEEPGGGLFMQVNRFSMVRKHTNLIFAVLIATLSLLIAACGSSSSQSSPKTSTTSSTGPQASNATLRVGYIASLAGGAVPAIGTHFGWYKSAGLNVKFISFTNAPAMATALVGGSLDIMLTGANGTLNSLIGYAKLIALDDFDNDSYILTSAKSGVTNIEELKGKTVAYTQGTNSEVLVLLALQAANLTATDITTSNLAPPSIVSAFLGGKISVASIFLPYSAAITSQQPDTNNISRVSDYLGGTAIPLMWAASDSALSTKMPEIQKYLQVMARVVDYRRTNLSQSAQIVYQFSGAPSLAPFTQQITAEQWPSDSQILSYYNSGLVNSSINKIESVLIAAHAVKQTLPSSMLDFRVDQSVLTNYLKN